MHAWNLWGSVPPTRLRTTGIDIDLDGDHFKSFLLLFVINYSLLALLGHGVTE